MEGRKDGRDIPCVVDFLRRQLQSLRAGLQKAVLDGGPCISGVGQLVVDLCEVLERQALGEAHDGAGGVVEEFSKEDGSGRCGVWKHVNWSCLFIPILSGQKSGTVGLTWVGGDEGAVDAEDRHVRVNEDGFLTSGARVEVFEEGGE